MIPKGNGPVPQQEEFGPNQPTQVEVYRRFEERFDRLLKLTNSRFDQQDENLNQLLEEMRATEQRSASLEQDARQPRRAMEADVTVGKKTRERMEGAADAVQARHGDICSAKRVQASPTRSISFGMKAEPPALPRRDDVLVDKGAAVPKPCLSPVEIRTRTAAGVLLSASTASTATRTTFHQPLISSCSTDEITLRTSNQYATNYSSFWKMKVLQTKLM